jgi:hypothetical protein
VRRAVREIAEELRAWLPNYDHGPDDYPAVLCRVLASLPGGDRLEDLGYETFAIGWHEADQLSRVLDAIQDQRDVEDLVDALLADEQDEE